MKYECEDWLQPACEQKAWTETRRGLASAASRSCAAGGENWYWDMRTLGYCWNCCYIETPLLHNCYIETCEHSATARSTTAWTTCEHHSLTTTTASSQDKAWTLIRLYAYCLDKAKFSGVKIGNVLLCKRSAFQTVCMFPLLLFNQSFRCSMGLHQVNLTDMRKSMNTEQCFDERGNVL